MLRGSVSPVSELIPLATLPTETAWVLRSLGLVNEDDTVDREHVRTLGEYLVRFAGTALAGARSGGALAPGVVGAVATRRTRTRRGPTKAELRSELTARIADHLHAHPGSTLGEIADTLDVPLADVTVAARPVDWLVLSEDELVEGAARRESETVVASRERARAALQAASLMVRPLTHQSYTNLVREGRVKGPSVARIVQLFGSWTSACAQVGVESGEPLRKNYSRTWTADELLGFVRRFLLESDYRGTSHQFDTWRATVNGDQKVPSLGTVRNVVGGTWNDIRAKALRSMRAEWNR